jgi:peptidyl-prolyl cis-trans isomerase SurA
MKNLFIKISTVLFSFIISQNIIAQDNNDDVLLEVGGEKITKSEFLNVYKKNNTKDQTIDKKSLNEYLDLYINFKLKVREAEDLGLDTIDAFKRELAGYRTQLAKPYLVDKDVNEELLQEAYERMNYDIRAKHILIKVGEFAFPKDTLKAYNKILKLRERIMNGESFSKIAGEESEDQSARDREATKTHPFIKGNQGDLGYFTVFDMVYPFENGAFNTPVGAVSQPIRTDYGYHLIKVTDKKKAMGRVQVAHLYLKIPQNANHEDSLKVKTKADSLYQLLLSGENYEKLVMDNSDDKGSAIRGGVLPWFGVNRMVPEFIQAISALKDSGQISEPVLTNYGWHIIKLIDKQEIGSLEDVTGDLKQKIAKDARSNKGREVTIAQVKKKYNFKEFPVAKAAFYKVVNDSVFKGKWDINNAKDLKEPMFVLGDKTYTQQDFAKYIDKKQKRRVIVDIQLYVDRMFENFVEESCIEYKDSQLENEYPEFKALMGEYRDGILLFELTDQKVWSKAIKDTIGLEEFYKNNSNKYMWDEIRVDASIFTTKDQKAINQVRKYALKAAKKGYSNQDILDMVNKDTILVKVERDKYLKGENKILDKLSWEKGVKDIIPDDEYTLVVINDVLQPGPKTLDEARGLVTADYQNYLEKHWIDELKKKYDVVIYDEVLSTIK